MEVNYIYVLYSVNYSTVQYNTVQYSIVQYSTMQYTFHTVVCSLPMAMVTLFLLCPLPAEIVSLLRDFFKLDLTGYMMLLVELVDL